MSKKCWSLRASRHPQNFDLIRSPNRQMVGSRSCRPTCHYGARYCHRRRLLLTFRDYGLGWDDYTHSQYGDLLLALYGSGFTDQRALSFVNLYKYGGGFDMAAALPPKFSRSTFLKHAGWSALALGSSGSIATWRIGRRLCGPAAGLIGLLLLATCPLYYGHMFINAKDAPFAASMVVLLLGMVRAFEEYPQPDPRTVALPDWPWPCLWLTHPRRHRCALCARSFAPYRRERSS